MLKADESKTEFTVLSKHSNLKKVGQLSMTLNDSEILSSKSVRNLGVIFDEELVKSSKLSLSEIFF